MLAEHEVVKARHPISLALPPWLAMTLEEGDGSPAVLDSLFELTSPELVAAEDVVCFSFSDLVAALAGGFDSPRGVSAGLFLVAEVGVSVGEPEVVLSD